MTTYGRFLLLLPAMGLFGYWLLVRLTVPSSPAMARVSSYGANGVPDTVEVPAGHQYQRGSVGQFFLGHHNRAIWTRPVKAKVLRLHQINGGLKIAEVGGGMQTLSFTLTDTSGRTYALRSVDKDPINVLPRFWRKTPVGNLVRDQIAGANPYGALVVPVLARAAGIVHPQPQLYYVLPHDPAFGAYAARVGGKLFLLEEKYNNAATRYPPLRSATAIRNTQAMLADRFRNNTQRVDQEHYLKCRLLDFLIGDWDRHNGQWVWAAYARGGETWFQPLPKDRDQAFGNYRDGLLPWLATRRWAAPKFGQFAAPLHDVYGLTVNAAYLDGHALVNLAEAQFNRTARELQRALTDAVIHRAVQQLPAPVRQLVGADITTHLRARRAQLPAAARQFYRLLAHQVTVAGSDQAELFTVQRLPDARTRVQVFRLTNGGQAGARLFNRVFYFRQTKQIDLHGLAGNDVFIISGEVAKAIRVDVHGGPGGDEITDKSRVPGPSAMTRVFDTTKGNTLQLGTEAADRTTSPARVPVFDREGL